MKGILTISGRHHFRKRHERTKTKVRFNDLMEFKGIVWYDMSQVNIVHQFVLG